MIVLAGAVAICAMILPGISGAFFLLVLGQYEYMTETLSAFVDAIVGLLLGGDLAPVVETGTVVVLFGAGATVSLFTMAHAVRSALERYRAATLAFLVSLMVGALRLPIVEVTTNVGDGFGNGFAAAVVAAVVGAGAVLIVDRYTADLEYAASGQ
jgi:putative membrane protein